jgi:hypothetical protein
LVGFGHGTIYLLVGFSFFLGFQDKSHVICVYVAMLVIFISLNFFNMVSKLGRPRLSNKSDLMLRSMLMKLLVK